MVDEVFLMLLVCGLRLMCTFLLVNQQGPLTDAAVTDCDEAVTSKILISTFAVFFVLIEDR